MNFLTIFEDIHCASQWAFTPTLLVLKHSHVKVLLQRGSNSGAIRPCAARSARLNFVSEDMQHRNLTLIHLTGLIARAAVIS